MLGNDLLAVSTNGHASVVAEWCGDNCPTSEQGASEAVSGGVAADADAEDKPMKPRFVLPGPVADAKIDPLAPHRLVFGGGENDLKIFDLAKEEVCWRAKNLGENSLCLRVPVRVSALQWATRLAPSRSLILCGTMDGKVRLYDAGMQRRPLFEMLIGYTTGQGSGGYTGVADDKPRPVNSSAIAQVRGDAWSLFVGNTTGALREYDLRRLPTAKTAEISPGRKSHLLWAAKQIPFKRGYSGIMGSIRGVDVHCSGNALVAVGLGRFAYVFETKNKRMISKVYLKQKLCSVLFSSEERQVPKEKEDAESGEEENAEEANEPGAAGQVEDEVQEGFSDDEAAVAREAEEEAGEDGGDGGGQPADEPARPKRTKRKAVGKVGGKKARSAT